MVKFKRILYISSLLITIGLQVSCEKRSNRAFIHNDTTQDVDVEYNFKSWNEATTIVHIEAGQAVEIPDIDHWEITQHTTNDSVVFTFEDGTREVHTYTIDIDSLGFGHETFIPEINNILSNSLDPHPSWTSKNTSGNKFRYDYHIRINNF